MKNKLIITILFIIIVLSSCTTQYKLPKHDEIDINEFGSLIKIELEEGGHTKGELIAVDSNKIVVLTEFNNTKKCIAINKKDIYSYHLIFTNKTDYSVTIPLYAAMCISHGLFALFTLPINLISTIAITASSECDNNYNEKELKYMDLHMFARFPQGIPPSINIDSIK